MHRLISMERLSSRIRPETAAELLDLLLRSRWFADSLFGQLLDQSQDYLNRSAQEFAVALVEKRCLSHWQATELLAGRNRFYRNGYRLIEQLADGPEVHFIAEQVRHSRLVILEIAPDTPAQRDQAFEFESGWLLSQRIRDRHFNQELLSHWRGQIDRILQALEPPQLEFVSPARMVIDAKQTVKCLQPLNHPNQLPSTTANPNLRAEVTRKMNEFLEEAAEKFESMFWSPAAGPAQPAERSRFVPLIRKGPSRSAIEALSADHQWEAERPDGPLPNLRNDEDLAIPDEAPGPSEIESYDQPGMVSQLPPVATQNTSQPDRWNLSRIRRISFATALALVAVIMVAWGGGRVWVPRIRAQEESKTPRDDHPPPRSRPAN